MLLRTASALACVAILIFAQRVRSANENQSSSAPDKKAPAVQPLSPAQQARFEAGKELYAVICGACHQPHGNGQEGLAPPLANSEWAIGSEERLIRISLQGLRGPIKVGDKTYQMEMPALAILEDEQIAAVLTYIRREWGNAAPPVDPKAVAKVRAETAKREDAWTEAELLNIP
ncbi:MAG: c-type cytochrome [Verrucomicrobia bacterium]|nr:c-type cytochrome [Verrucomicrobiota bacterium]